MSHANVHRLASKGWWIFRYGPAAGCDFATRAFPMPLLAIDFTSTEADVPPGPSIPRLSGLSSTPLHLPAARAVEAKVQSQIILAAGGCRPLSINPVRGIAARPDVGLSRCLGRDAASRCLIISSGDEKNCYFLLA